jgi:hypothetical protein
MEFFPLSLALPNLSIARHIPFVIIPIEVGPTLSAPASIKNQPQLNINKKNTDNHQQDIATYSTAAPKINYSSGRKDKTYP